MATKSTEASKDEKAKEEPKAVAPAKAHVPAKAESKPAERRKPAVSAVDELREKRANYDLVSGRPVNPPREAVVQAPVPQVIERDGQCLELVADGQNTRLSLGGQKLLLNADGVRELFTVVKRRVSEL